MESVPFVKKPLGPSKLGRGFGTNWNNQRMGCDGPVTCEICGTVHPRDGDESYVVSIFLGRQVVEDCCGAILDQVYQESGEEFAIAFLKEFSKNPTDSRFHCFLSVLRSVLVEAKKKLSEVGGKVKRLIDILEA